MTILPFAVFRREGGRLTNLVSEQRTLAEAIILAERHTAGNPGNEYVVYEARTRSFYKTVVTEEV